MVPVTLHEAGKNIARSIYPEPSSLPEAKNAASLLV
jgi:hypothetical protein